MTVILLNGRELGTIESRGQLNQWLENQKFQEGVRTTIPTSTNLDDPKASRESWLVGTGQYKQTKNRMGIYYLDDARIVLIPVSTVATFQTNSQRRAQATVPTLQSALAITA
ncbi:MAG: hypothetical protein M1275_03375 [Patescibacteria group bacterium]|nr:hypothetical protein [Patescibacteria group bacterium]